MAVLSHNVLTRGNVDAGGFFFFMLKHSAEAYFVFCVPHSFMQHLYIQQIHSLILAFLVGVKILCLTDAALVSSGGQRSSCKHSDANKALLIQL